MKIILILGALFLASLAHAEDYFVSGKPATKVEALRAAITDPKLQVTRCDNMEITKKGTLHKKD